GVYQVTLGVVDSAGGVGSGTTFVVVSSNTLSASIVGAPKSALEGTPITLTDGAPAPSLVGPLHYSWNVTGPAGFSLPAGTVTSASAFAFTPDRAGSYAVSLTVTAGQLQPAQDQVSVLVVSGLPVVT